MSQPCSPSQPGNYPSDCEVMDGYRAMARERVQHKDLAQTDPLVLAKAREIKLLLLDVDGVLTDGSLLYGAGGEELKSFHSQDGFGIRLLQEGGVAVGLITSRTSEIVRRRGDELGVSHLHQGVAKKVDAYRSILKSTGLKPIEIAYMGDDWLDLALLQQVGLALAPPNGVPEVLERVHYVTPRAGGHGAVRDACSLLLFAQDKLTKLHQEYLHG